MMDTKDLIKLIRENKNAIENRDGFTPLFALAENIATGCGDVFPKDAEKLILSLDLSLFNVDEIDTLNSFIYYSKLETDAITKKYFTFINEQLHVDSVGSLYKKGILMLFIIESDPSKFSLENIHEEKALHKKFPWIWIDCITQYDWHSAEHEICNLLTKKYGLKNLIYRLPIYKELAEKHSIKLTDSLDLWYNTMNNKSKNELKKWTEIFDIPFEEPIPVLQPTPVFQPIPVLQSILQFLEKLFKKHIPLEAKSGRIILNQHSIINQNQTIHRHA